MWQRKKNEAGAEVEIIDVAENEKVQTEHGGVEQDTNEDQMSVASDYDEAVMRFFLKLKFPNPDNNYNPQRRESIIVHLMTVIS